MRWGILVLVAAGCSGTVETGEPGVRTLTPPLSIECTADIDCRPGYLGYATCLENRCSFRCDPHIHQGETRSNTEECDVRGGTCEDMGGGNWFCVVR